MRALQIDSQNLYYNNNVHFSTRIEKELLRIITLLSRIFRAEKDFADIWDFKYSVEPTIAVIRVFRAPIFDFFFKILQFFLEFFIFFSVYAPKTVCCVNGSTIWSTRARR